MAILLIHLRRIILIFAVIYLISAVLSKLVFGANNRKYTKLSRARPFGRRVHFQLWTYVYALYIYTVICNWVNVVTIFITDA